ncbi:MULTISPECIES: hypothetical protein [unclassified Mesorhizobium]|uniref:hypothetical protein n=1 Tax=unclassified Mesorhizobium TaxID=325217 RepID=UPI00112AAEF1|nr:MULTISPECIES: hypothetical protein [unclassified Mesorhizobium]TPK68477.1 hypothetical protein FJ551_01755 [Mesorhizobium sp. B2-5-1]TPM62722.1 hypothetical protein FJ962_10095 [Mesorhizobium sp. B2-1-9]TPM87598.1 hypothetical protein FJ963_06180 [Mesorhizobium sp. B2-1-4]TPN12388.1 hypothetical protein FJ971_06635 [Mesorhizobium sp. B2-1-2]UCI15590.1 hypothetical protein FJ972_12430 [Mesorhizobium sp. B2-1-1]
MLQILELLKPGTSLTAVGVEGVKADTPAGTDGPTWDGVDVALYYGAASLEDADRVEFAQLKYSSANPETPWTVARMTYNTAKKGNNSPLRKLADAFKGGRARMKTGTAMRIRFVSNQAIADDLGTALAARWTGDLATAGLPEIVVANLRDLQSASGLNQSEFAEFVACLDVTECGVGSRFKLQENIVSVVAEHLGDDVSSEARDLQMRVRELMLPERANEVVTGKNVLLWFGFSARDGLFPSEPDIRLPANPIKRAAAHTVLNQLNNGSRVVLVHGVGGCGKTTLMRQVQDGLPSGSVSVNFDCFGGGRYIYADDKRHLPEKAFLQLTNEIALALQLPLFIPRDLKYPAHIGLFLSKLRTAAKALEQLDPNAFLVIIIDAADNSVAAASAANPQERSFVHDLANANLAELPDNIRFILSARTARKDTLLLPSDIIEVECPLFDLSETKQHLETVVSNPSDTYAEQFHALSHQNPRVQAYAISASSSDRSKLLDVLRPGGKTLPDVLRLTFDSALKKLGQSAIFDRLLAALAFLPAPANVGAIARVAGSQDGIVRDWAGDLLPGLRLDDGAISIADEDFEAYIRETSSKDRIPTLARIADDFLSNFATDAYASLHVADALGAADRANQLLTVVERDPQVGAIGDAVLKRQVQVRRLWLALRASRHAGTVVDALKTILISAEAEKDDSTLTDLLEKELDLSVEFSGASLRRTILLERDRIAEHGTFLAYDAARAGRADDGITTREQLHFYDAWLQERRNVPEDKIKDWEIEDREIAARTEAILYLGGPEQAFLNLMRWSPRSVPLRVAFILIPQLIATGKSSVLRDLLNQNLVPRPWDLVVWTALASAGESVDAKAIEQSLKRVRRRLVPDPGEFLSSYGEEGWQKSLLDSLIVSCELAYRLNVDTTVLLGTLNEIMKCVEGKPRHLYSHDFYRIDALYRCWLLRTELRGDASDIKEFSSYVKSLEPPPPPEDKPKRGSKKATPHSPRDDQRDRRLQIILHTLFPVYAARLAVLIASRNAQSISPSLLEPLGSIGSSAWEFDQDHDSIYLRAVAARAVMSLLIVPRLTAVELEARASGLLRGKYGDWLAVRRAKLWEQMRVRPAEANALIELIAKASAEVRDARASASDKLETMVRLARLALPVSRSDSEALFNDAVGIAKEIDHEAIDQIEFAEAAAQAASFDDPQEGRRIAGNLFTFVSGAYERLSSRDFNWNAAVGALVATDLPCALAAVSRWADEGAVQIEITLETLIPLALKRELIGAREAAALALVMESADATICREVAVHAAGSDPEVVEEVAKDALLLASQSGRVSNSSAILEQLPASAHRSSWTARLQRTVEFHKLLGNREQPARVAGRGRPARSEIADELAKEFVFEPTGPFANAEAIETVLKEATASGLRHTDRVLLEKMMDASSDVKHRVPFLKAIVSISDEAIWRGTREEALFAAIKRWKGTPGVDRWCRDELPAVVVRWFGSLARWIKQGQSTLGEMLQLTGLDASGKLSLILSGVAEDGDALGSRSLFGVAELICENIGPHDLGLILSWYSDRMLARIPAAQRQSFPLQNVPLRTAEAIGRFVVALMSDIDTRIRWRAAHCFRRLARFKCQDAVSATISQMDRADDPAFRDPTAPFFFLGARLWLALAMYRVSAESPSALAPFKDVILSLATSRVLPHVGIREYAKRTLIQLASSGDIGLDAAEKLALDSVNLPLKGETGKERKLGASFDKYSRDEKRRFRFDGLDTLRYWYEDILRIFPTVFPDQVLKIAERWIVDKWGADPEANRWDKESRRGRYNERRFGLWSTSHGSLPTIERYGSHLEWHAMHCTIGELLETHPVAKGEMYYDRFDYWLSRSLPTSPPEWLSDHRTTTPLEAQFWREDPRTDQGWLSNAGRDDVLKEIGLLKSSRPGWIVVKGYCTAHFPKREANTAIHTALVSSKPALSLVRALQTVSNHYDFRIPDEGDDDEINEPLYKLTGWLAHFQGDTRFDDRDPSRYEVGRIQAGPGQALVNSFELVQQTDGEVVWVCKKSGEAALIYEAWCDEPSREDDYPRQTKSDGWRLWARAGIVQSFLMEKKMDLVCEVRIDRRLRNEYRSSYDSDEKKKTHDKILLLAGDGSIRDYRGHFGVWQTSRRRVRA